MKNGTRKIVLIAVLTLVVLAVLTGCSTKQNKADYDHLVTYKYNVGDITANCEDQFIGVYDGKRTIQPGDLSFKLYVIPGYYIEGWYTAVTDEAGEPVVNPESNRVELDRKWNFDTDRVTENVTLYANLCRIPTLKFIDRATGETVGEWNEKPGERRNRPTAHAQGAPKKEGYTLYDYYVSADDDRKFEWPYVFGTEDDSIYVEFIEGNWTIVNSVKAFDTALGSANDIYVDADLDFSESDTVWKVGTLNKKIAGNGHVFSGISVSFEANKISKDGFGLFSKLGSKAEISNLEFRDVKISFDVKLGDDFSVGFLAYEAAEGARINNVKLSGVLTYDFGAAERSTVSEWIALDATSEDDINNCDYSEVKLEKKQKASE